MAPLAGMIRYNTDTLRLERSTDEGASWLPLDISGSGGVPAGCVMQTARTTAPTGWLLCDGASLLRADYADLFAAIGTTFGAADGTHFNVPDGRSRTIIGVGQGSGLTNRALAAIVGVETHALSTGELAAHVHNIDPPSTETGSEGSHTHTVDAHTHGIELATGASGANRVNLATNNSIATTIQSLSASPGTSNPGPHTHSVNIAPFDSASAGGGNAHQNMQPSLALNFIIKI